MPPKFPKHIEKFFQDPAIEFLAHESHRTIEDVTKLYRNKMAKLEIIAHIKSFLPIFAIRNVRKILHRKTDR